MDLPTPDMTGKRDNYIIISVFYTSYTETIIFGNYVQRGSSITVIKAEIPPSAAVIF